MKMLRRWCAVMAMWMVSGLMLAAQQPTRQQEEFIPIDQLPPTDQLPAAPLLIGAYAFVLAVLFLYVYSLKRRLTTVQQELDRLDTTIKQSGRAGS
jgi:CcmD family protein